MMEEKPFCQNCLEPCEPMSDGAWFCDEDCRMKFEIKMFM